MPSKPCEILKEKSSWNVEQGVFAVVNVTIENEKVEKVNNFYM